MNILDNEWNNKKYFSSNVIINTPRFNKGPANSPWPMFRHDLNHTGKSQYDTSKNNGQKKWEFTTGDYVSSSPAIGPDDTIYIGSYDNKLYALYPNGTKKWDFATEWSIESSPMIGSDGIIYIGSRDGKLYALYPNGTKKWDYITGNEVLSSPAIGSDGSIYFGSYDGGLYALYPNGTKKWNFTTGDSIFSSPAIGSDGTIYIGSWDCRLYAIGISVSSVPQNFKAIGGNAQVKLTWTTPSNNGGSAIINYTIYRGTTSGCETFLLKIGDVITYLDSSVTNGKKYYYEVTANNNFGESPKSNEANATPATTPTAPQNLTATPGNAQIALNWTTPAENGGFSITNFTVYRNGTRLKLLGNVNTYTDSGLINGVTYSYNISAMNSVGEGPKSIGVNATPRTVPSAPRDLHVTLGNAQIALTWIVPTSNGGAPIMNYNIYRGTARGGETLLVKGYTGGSSWVDTNTILGTKYYYMVSAVNIAGEGPRSNVANATSMTMPSAPQNLTAVLGNAQIILNWTAPIDVGGTSITSYNIYRGTTSNGELLFIMGYTGGTSWADTQVTTDTAYYYVVSAVNTVGEGPKSNEKNITFGNPPHMPTRLTASGGNSQVILRWSALASGGTPTQYNVYRADSQSGIYTLIASPTRKQYTDTGLKNGHTYWYKINTQNAYGVSGNTTAISITPYTTSTITVGPFLLGFIVIIIVALFITEAMRLSKKKGV